MGKGDPSKGDEAAIDENDGYCRMVFLNKLSDPIGDPVIKERDPDPDPVTEFFFQRVFESGAGLAESTFWMTFIQTAASLIIAGEGTALISRIPENLYLYGAVHTVVMGSKRS